LVAVATAARAVPFADEVVLDAFLAGFVGAVAGAALRDPAARPITFLAAAAALPARDLGVVRAMGAGLLAAARECGVGATRVGGG
jgi:hypothetical protein